VKRLIGRLRRWRERRRREFRYGDSGTIHRTGQVNVERDMQTGEVVAVWYRCRLLPFTDTEAGPGRVHEMRDAYRKRPPSIRAIVFEDDGD